MNYPAIEDHALIGDMQTAALVATDGTVDFMCLPRFDSPTIFASLLDQRNGGRFTLAPAGQHVTKQMYLPNTAVLVTRYLSEGESPRSSTSCRWRGPASPPISTGWSGWCAGSAAR